MLTVWIDSWQMQCCGRRFAVGDQVVWTLVPDPDLDYPESVLGEDMAGSITHREEHHGGLPDDASITAATVRSISAIFCDYGPAPDGKTLYPISGTQAVKLKDSADGWEDETDQRFVAYLVELVEGDDG